VLRSDVPKKLSTVATNPLTHAVCLCELRAHSEREGVCSRASSITLVRIVLAWSYSCSRGGAPISYARQLLPFGPAPACTTHVASACTGGTCAQPTRT
jgi:hypothetical protein